MKKETIVQFVVFETTLDSREFFVRWEQYNRSTKDDATATLQRQVLKNGMFKYVSQHKCSSNQFQFVLNKERRTSRNAVAEIRKKLTGGYSAIQLEYTGEAKADESKIMIFVFDQSADLDSFRQFSVHGKLNIYEAYYENCEFAYILEFFVKNEYAADVLQQLKILTSFAEAGIYTECHKS
jgi:hypothetical protein